MYQCKHEYIGVENDTQLSESRVTDVDMEAKRADARASTTLKIRYSIQAEDNQHCTRQGDEQKL